MAAAQPVSLAAASGSPEVGAVRLGPPAREPAGGWGRDGSLWCAQTRWCWFSELRSPYPVT